MLRILQGGLDDPQVIAMLKYHFDTNMAITPPGSAHVFDHSRLKASDVYFFSAWQDGTLMGTSALKTLGAQHGEVKSMHTLKTNRRSGVASQLLQHIMAQAKSMGLKRLSLETGSFEYFAPARSFYAKHGFTECAPFGDYRPDANSTFMTMLL